MSVALDILLLSTSWTHVLLAPYNKVEESFNLHATHDVLAYGVGAESLSKYDHFVFPGAVPRTFIGSLILAFLARPAIYLANHLGAISSKADIQVVIRLVLATYNVLGFSLLRRAVSRRYGGATGVLFVLITCTQFHLPFWMGRTLPNMLALLPVNIASYLLWNRYPNATRPFQRDIHLAIALLTFTTVVFRAEVLLLLGPVVLQALWQRYTTLWKVVRVGIVSGVASVALTVTVDSFFWQRWPVWPELYGLYFNVLQGKSAEWGVSPIHAYYTSHLPKLLTTSTLLIPIGALTDSRIRSLLLPALAFVALLSGLGHKEWRFVVYVVPVFNVAGARGGAWLISRRKGSLFGRLAFLAVASFLALNCAITFLSSVAAINNYPGGVALARFNEMYAGRRGVHVHISNLAAQTGASLFLQTNAPPSLPFFLPSSSSLFPLSSLSPHSPPLPHSHLTYSDDWIYNKTENVTPEEITSNRAITHVLAEVHSPPSHSSPNAGGVYTNEFDATGFPKNSWVMTAVIPGFDGWRLDLGALRVEPWKPWRVMVYAESGKVVLLERRGW